MTEKQKTCLGFYEKDAQERETCHGINGLRRDSTYYFDIKQEKTFQAVPKADYDKLKKRCRTLENKEGHKMKSRKDFYELGQMTEDTINNLKENSIPKEKVRKFAKYLENVDSDGYIQLKDVVADIREQLLGEK